MTVITRLAALAASVSLLAACSTIVEGTDQSVTVMTDPSGASCKLQTGSRVVAVVNPTPGTVQLDKSKDNVSVLCEKDGYQPSAGTLASSFEGMTFGNIIFGGIIGVGVDAASGAMNKYPDSVTIQLAPNSFPSAAARDSYYDGKIAERRVQHERTRTLSASECTSDATTCESRLKALDAVFNADIADLERKRQSTRIDGA